MSDRFWVWVGTVIMPMIVFAMLVFPHYENKLYGAVILLVSLISWRIALIAEENMLDE